MIADQPGSSKHFFPASIFGYREQFMRKKAMQLFVIVAGCLITTGLPAQSEEADKSKTETKKDFKKGPGIEVGAELPDIKLKDQNGDEVSIRELAKSKTVALVFYRSADW